MKTLRAIAIGLLTFASLVDAQTNFFIQNIQTNAGGSVTITWPVISSQPNYYVFHADSVHGSWQVFPDGLLIAGPTNLTLSYTDVSVALASQRFYKVGTSVPQLVMTLVLDRSGSMAGLPGGGRFLPSAVSYFISLFDDNNDNAAMVSFSTTATLDVPMGRPFKQAISTAASNFFYDGGTFSQGGLTNALVQNNSVVPLPGQSLVKVVVFFTDGLANIFQDTLNCSVPTTWNIGGSDSGNTVEFFNPTTGMPICSLFNGGAPPCCSGTSQFQSAIDGTLKSFVRTNTTAEAQYRTLQVAAQMRAAHTYVYAIGLGIGVDSIFLQEVANDPSSPTFNPAQPVGAAVIASSATDLQAVFQQIAAKIHAF